MITKSTCRECGSTIENLSKKEPETFDWTVAMILVGQGEKVQVRGVFGERWMDIELNGYDYIAFSRHAKYRRKPAELVEPVVTKSYANIYNHLIGPQWESLEASNRESSASSLQGIIEIERHDGKVHSIRLIKKDSV